MAYEEERKRQILCEINWLKDEVKKAKKQKHKKDLERQIKEREYNYHLAVYKK